MDHPELIQPGDRVFLAVPPDLNQRPEEVAMALDETYPGVDFEVLEYAGQERPEIIFTYRDPRALATWLEEQKVDNGDNGVGLTLASTMRETNPRPSFPVIG